YAMTNYVAEIKGSLSLATAAGKIQHVCHNVGRSLTGLANIVEKLNDLAVLQILIDLIQLDAELCGGGLVGADRRREPAMNILNAVQNDTQRIVYLVGHT